MKIFSCYSTFSGTAELEYTALTFSQADLLLGVSGCPDFKLALWDWRLQELICIATLDIRVILRKQRNCLCFVIYNLMHQFQTVEVELKFAPDAGKSAAKAFSVLSEGKLSVWKVARVGKKRSLIQDGNPEVDGLRNCLAGCWLNAHTVAILTMSGIVKVKS